MSDGLPDPRNEFLESESSDEDEDLFNRVNDLEINNNNNSNESEDKPKISSKNTKKTKGRKRLGPKPIICIECSPTRTFKKQKVLEKHMKVIHQMVRYTCLWCALNFSTPNQLLVHQKLYRHDKDPNS
jgi:hypothetical protein